MADKCKTAASSGTRASTLGSLPSRLASTSACAPARHRYSRFSPFSPFSPFLVPAPAARLAWCTRCAASAAFTFSFLRASPRLGCCGRSPRKDAPVPMQSLSPARSGPDLESASAACTLGPSASGPECGVVDPRRGEMSSSSSSSSATRSTTHDPRAQRHGEGCARTLRGSLASRPDPARPTPQSWGAVTRAARPTTAKSVARDNDASSRRRPRSADVIAQPPKLSARVKYIAPRALQQRTDDVPPRGRGEAK